MFRADFVLISILFLSLFRVLRRNGYGKSKEHWNIWKMFLLAIPGQIAIILWFRLYRKGAKEENDG